MKKFGKIAVTCLLCSALALPVCANAACRSRFSLLQEYALRLQSAGVSQSIADPNSFLRAILSSFSSDPRPAKPSVPTSEPQPAPAPSVPVSSAQSSEERAMLAMINEERAKQGLAAYTYDAALSAIARKKAQDMLTNHYFAHQSPTYGSLSEMLSAFGYTYRAAGENIAKYGSVERAHIGLMNSDGHRKNILGRGFTRAGIGIVQDAGGVYYICQLFAA